MLRETGPNPGNVPLSTEQFLDNPGGLRQVLEERGALTFAPYSSGLFPASELTPEMAAATEMDRAWFRDGAHVVNALIEAGQLHLAVPAAEAMMTVLHNNRDVLDGVVNNPLDSPEGKRRLPVRVNGHTLENDNEPRAQTDSTGYALWAISRVISAGGIAPNLEDLDTLAQTVRYLEKIEFWQTPDDGHWEEKPRIHASSIGAAIAGLQEAQTMFRNNGYWHTIDFTTLQHASRAALHAILEKGVTEIGHPSELQDSELEQTAPFPKEITPEDCVIEHFKRFSVDRRQYDAALLFLIEPLDVIQGKTADKIIANVEEHLLRDKGIARYAGDTYWEPRFPDIMDIEERTRFAEGRTDQRNQTAAGIAYNGTEAQWTLFDSVLSTIWGKRYQQSGNPEHRQQQLYYLDRSLSQLVTTADGGLRMPEAYYHEYDESTGKNHLIPNDHTPLLWAQANLLNALRVFEQIR